MTNLECSATGGVATLTLNRPRAYNALSLELMTQLQAKLQELDQDSKVQAIIICGAGAGFCAGHDLKELQANKSEDFYKNIFNECSNLMMKVKKIKKPVIAAVHGIATAAGCQLVASCDLAVATEDAAFATPGVNIGLFCSTPMVALTRNIAPKHAMAMLLTGTRVSADKAKAIGLINEISKPEKHLELATQLAQTIAEKSPLTLAIGKEAFYNQNDMTITEAYAYCSEVMTKNMLTLDAQEGIQAQLEKRPARWQGC